MFQADALIKAANHDSNRRIGAEPGTGHYALDLSQTLAHYTLFQATVHDVDMVQPALKDLLGRHPPVTIELKNTVAAGWFAFWGTDSPSAVELNVQVAKVLGPLADKSSRCWPSWLSDPSLADQTRAAMVASQEEHGYYGVGRPKHVTFYVGKNATEIAAACSLPCHTFQATTVGVGLLNEVGAVLQELCCFSLCEAKEPEKEPENPMKLIDWLQVRVDAWKLPKADIADPEAVEEAARAVEGGVGLIKLLIGAPCKSNHGAEILKTPVALRELADWLAQGRLRPTAYDSYAPGGKPAPFTSVYVPLRGEERLKTQGRSGIPVRDLLAVERGSDALCAFSTQDHELLEADRMFAQGRFYVNEDGVGSFVLGAWYARAPGDDVPRDYVHDLVCVACLQKRLAPDPFSVAGDDKRVIDLLTKYNHTLHLLTLGKAQSDVDAMSDQRLCDLAAEYQVPSQLPDQLPDQVPHKNKALKKTLAEAMVNRHNATAQALAHDIMTHTEPADCRRIAQHALQLNEVFFDRLGLTAAEMIAVVCNPAVRRSFMAAPPKPQPHTGELSVFLRCVVQLQKGTVLAREDPRWMDEFNRLEAKRLEQLAKLQGMIADDKTVYAVGFAV